MIGAVSASIFVLVMGRMTGLARAQAGQAVSPRQLQSTDFLDMIAETLARQGLDPSWLTVEITESVLGQDTEAVMTRLQEPQPGHRARPRRLRHRLLVAQLPPPLSDPDTEDRPVLRPGHGEHDDRSKILNAIVSLRPASDWT